MFCYRSTRSSGTMRPQTSISPPGIKTLLINSHLRSLYNAAVSYHQNTINSTSPTQPLVSPRHYFRSHRQSVNKRYQNLHAVGGGSFFKNKTILSFPISYDSFSLSSAQLSHFFSRLTETPSVIEFSVTVELVKCGEREDDSSFVYRLLVCSLYTGGQTVSIYRSVTLHWSQTEVLYFITVISYRRCD